MKRSAAALVVAWSLLKARKAMGGFDYSQLMKKDDDTPDHHFWLEVDPVEKLAILRALRGLEPDLKSKPLLNLRERVQDARRIEGPRLAEARLDWDELERTALKQGCSQADVIWDRGKGKE